MDDYKQGKNETSLPRSLATFDWDTKMKDLLPEDWGMMDKWANEKASLRDALSHVTGLFRLVLPRCFDFQRETDVFL